MMTSPGVSNKMSRPGFLASSEMGHLLKNATCLLLGECIFLFARNLSFTYTPCLAKLTQGEDGREGGWLPGNLPIQWFNGIQ